MKVLMRIDSGYDIDASIDHSPLEFLDLDDSLPLLLIQTKFPLPKLP